MHITATATRLANLVLTKAFFQLFYHQMYTPEMQAKCNILFKIKFSIYSDTPFHSEPVALCDINLVRKVCKAEASLLKNLYKQLPNQVLKIVCMLCWCMLGVLDKHTKKIKMQILKFPLFPKYLKDILQNCFLVFY